MAPGAVGFPRGAQTRRAQALGRVGREAPAHLHRVVGLSRSRPSDGGVSQPGLAGARPRARVLPLHFERSLRLSSVAGESFVDPAEHSTCYRASNWTLLGRTRGRGRQDASGVPSTVQEVYAMCWNRIVLARIGVCKTPPEPGELDA